jgi:S1-C subfamily serine protease
MRWWTWVGLIGWLWAVSAEAAERASLADAVRTVQPKIVKIHGAGGLRGLEAYQSGFLISARGHVLTAWSYVLDCEYIAVTLDDGRKFQGQLVGADPRCEIAVLKIEADEVPYFSLREAVELNVGDRVLAFSNLFGVATGDEAASVLRGCVSARTPLNARRGAFETPYRGLVYVLDAMTNNPGAAGGALTDRRGRLAGILGKELRNAASNVWLNYAIPIGEIAQATDDILAGKVRPRAADEKAKKPSQPWTVELTGMRLLPNVLPKTPPFVDDLRPESPAARAGLRRDDLILFINQRVVSSARAVAEELALIDRIDPVRLTVQRGQELVEMTVEGLK